MMHEDNVLRSEKHVADILEVDISAPEEMVNNGVLGNALRLCQVLATHSRNSSVLPCSTASIITHNYVIISSLSRLNCYLAVAHPSYPLMARGLLHLAPLLICKGRMVASEGSNILYQTMFSSL